MAKAPRFDQSSDTLPAVGDATPATGRAGEPTDLTQSEGGPLRGVSGDLAHPGTIPTRTEPADAPQTDHVAD